MPRLILVQMRHQLAFLLLLAALLLVAWLSQGQPRRIGDGVQVVLPLAGLACAVTSGDGVRYAGRYMLVEAGIRLPKYGLGDAPVNRRPGGGGQGFPSGHTAAASFGATALALGCLRGNPGGQALAVMSAGFVGASRIDAGKHTIWQTLAGAVLGWAAVVLKLHAFDRGFQRVWGRIVSPATRRLRRPVRRLRRRVQILALSGLAAISATGAKAEVELWAYTGYQAAPHSSVEGSDPRGAGDFDFNAGWEGKPFEMPPHWGLRGVWWRSETVGLSVDFNHTKVYADDDTLKDSGFKTLEFTDGLNNLTAGIMRRWPGQFGSITPYAGLSAGVVIPHVEVQTAKGAPSTFEYQLAGPTVALVLGASYPIGERVALFGEYKGTYSWLDVDLDGGGDLSTDIITNALNVGLSYRF